MILDNHETRRLSGRFVKHVTRRPQVCWNKCLNHSFWTKRMENFYNYRSFYFYERFCFFSVVVLFKKKKISHRLLFMLHGFFEMVNIYKSLNHQIRFYEHKGYKPQKKWSSCWIFNLKKNDVFSLEANENWRKTPPSFFRSNEFVIIYLFSDEIPRYIKSHVELNILVLYTRTAWLSPQFSFVSD